MSRTYKASPDNPHRKESKIARKLHYRKHRRQSKADIFHGREITPFPFKTSGWLTH